MTATMRSNYLTWPAGPLLDAIQARGGISAVLRAAGIDPTGGQGASLRRRHQAIRNIEAQHRPPRRSAA